MGDLSPHFSRVEFDCHDGQLAHPAPELIAALERLRHLCGDRPMRIVSGYRDVEYNRAIGGAPSSQHLYNRAADIRSGYARYDQALKAGFTGIGTCNGWVVHVDVRRGPDVTFRDC